MVDFFLVLKLAGAGDELQGIKRGILELADLIAINKADGENVQAAELARAEFERALGCLGSRAPRRRYQPARAPRGAHIANEGKQLAPFFVPVAKQAGIAAEEQSRVAGRVLRPVARHPGGSPQRCAMIR